MLLVPALPLGQTGSQYNDDEDTQLYVTLTLRALLSGRKDVVNKCLEFETHPHSKHWFTISFLLCVEERCRKARLALSGRKDVVNQCLEFEPVRSFRTYPSKGVQ